MVQKVLKLYSSFTDNDAGDNGGAIGIYFSSNILKCILTGNESIIMVGHLIYMILEDLIFQIKL